MIRKTVTMLACSVLLSTGLYAFDAASAAKDVYTKAGGNKTESQWKRYFGKAKWQAKLGIDGMSDGDRASLLEYLNARSADKDQATVPQ